MILIFERLYKKRRKEAIIIYKIDNVYNLVGFYNENIWNLKKHPDKLIRQQFRKYKNQRVTLDFNEMFQREKIIVKELKLYLFNIIENKEMSGLNIVKRYIIPIKILLKFLLITDKKIDSIISLYENNELKRKYIRYLKKSGYKIKYSNGQINARLKILQYLYDFLIKKYDDRVGFERDVWYINQLNLSSERINQINDIKTFRFHNIDYGKAQLKKYIKNLVLNTTYALGGIYNKLTYIKEFLNFIKKDISSITRSDIEMYFSYILDQDNKDTTYNTKLRIIMQFLQYMKSWDIIDKELLSKKDLIYVKKMHNYNTVDQYVIKQIFNKLHNVSHQLRTMFVLIFCTGMRVSDVCQMKINCVYKLKDYYYIRYFCQKMRKEVVNPIPKKLYELLKIQEKDVLKIYKEEAKYIFPSNYNNAYGYKTFRNDMEKFILKNNIVNRDGSLYKFLPHSYRHTYGTILFKHGISLDIIQELLHHESQEMTDAYVDIVHSHNDKVFNNLYKTVN